MADVLTPQALEVERLLRQRPTLDVKAREIRPLYSPPATPTPSPPPPPRIPKRQPKSAAAPPVEPLFRGYPDPPFVSPFPPLHTTAPALVTAAFATYQAAKPAATAARDFARKHPLATVGLGVLAVGAIHRYLKAAQPPAADSTLPVELRRLRSVAPR